MSTLIVRALVAAEVRWGRLISAAPKTAEDRVQIELLTSRAGTTSGLIADLARDPRTSDETVTILARDILSPVTPDATLLCQGLNYREHAAEAGHNVRKSNLFFVKASSSLSPPYGDILRPDGVELLDYEAEIGIVLRRDLEAGATITDANVGEYVAGVTLVNDVSARDTMFGASFMQWFRGKSFRTFCPTGPVLYLLEPSEVASTIAAISFSLRFRGETKQSASTSQLIYKVPETLTEIAQFMDLKRGDMILSGTPGGVLAHPTPQILSVLKEQLLDDSTRKALFVEQFKKIDPFMLPGDTVTLTMKDARNSVSLGGQQCRIV